LGAIGFGKRMVLANGWLSMSLSVAINLGLTMQAYLALWCHYFMFTNILGHRNLSFRICSVIRSIFEFSGKNIKHKINIIIKS
jgi:hypothetical protein